VCLNSSSGYLNIYKSSNGLLNDQFNYNSAYKDAEGEMYFGSVSGMISFKPDEFRKDTFTPNIFITGFQVQNKELEIGNTSTSLKKSILYTDKIRLDYNKSSFSIDFAALNFTDPENTEYAYKMEGLDRDYTYLKTNRKVYFTELSPGTYTFRVKGANSSGVWNNQERKLLIEITPPFWASPLAYIVYLAAGLLMGYWLIRLYRNKIEEKNRKNIQHLEYEKEKEVYQAKIDFFTNVAHEIRTPLTLIKAPLEKVISKVSHVPEIKNSLIIMERNTNRLVDLTNQLLDFRKTEANGFSLNFEKTNITELLEEIYTSFKHSAEEKGILFEITLPKTPVWAFVDNEAFRKITSNLFSNAVKYSASRVSTSLLPFTSRHDLFTIEVKNDGYPIPHEMNEKIFEPFYRIKQTERQTGSGIGLSISRSLAELHKGTLYLQKQEDNLNVFVLNIPARQEEGSKLNSEEYAAALPIK
jgi:signal transduction histidine kinase